MSTMTAEQLPEEMQKKRKKTIVYTRVMGYHRPVESFNLGKTGEHKDRVKFAETDAEPKGSCSARPKM